MRDDVRYAIHIAQDNDVQAGRATLNYRLNFQTSFANPATTLQAYLGQVDAVFDPNQNLRQTYKVRLLDRRAGASVLLGEGMVPPNNQGLVTPFYNQGNDSESPAKGGVASEASLDRYTRQAIVELDRGHRAFAG